MVIAGAWRASERGSIPRGGTTYKENYDGAVAVLLMLVVLIYFIDKNLKWFYNTFFKENDMKRGKR